MKAAFTIWKDRIAPLFDVAGRIEVVESDTNRIVTRTRMLLVHSEPEHKIRQLAEMGVDMLVCGAISRPAQNMAAAFDIELVPFVNGDLQAVITAWLHGRLGDEYFSMPGCRVGRRRFQNRHIQAKGGGIMNTTTDARRGPNRKARGSRGQGGQKKQRGRQGRGRTGAAVNTDQCVCPVCGHQEPHELGVPCISKICARCGATMTRS